MPLPVLVGKDAGDQQQDDSRGKDGEKREPVRTGYGVVNFPFPGKTGQVHVDGSVPDVENRHGAEEEGGCAERSEEEEGGLDALDHFSVLLKVESVLIVQKNSSSAGRCKDTKYCGIPLRERRRRRDGSDGRGGNMFGCCETLAGKGVIRVLFP